MPSAEYTTPGLGILVIENPEVSKSIWDKANILHRRLRQELRRPERRGALVEARKRPPPGPCAELPGRHEQEGCRKGGDQAAHGTVEAGDRQGLGNFI